MGSMPPKIRNKIEGGLQRKVLQLSSKAKIRCMQLTTICFVTDRLKVEGSGDEEIKQKINLA